FAISKQISTDIQQSAVEKRAIRPKLVTPSASSSQASVVAAIPVAPVAPVSTSDNKSQYLEVTDSCGAHFGGECLRVRSGPGTDFPVVASLRNGMVLKIDETIVTDGVAWHKIIFDEWLRYPERHKGDWYIAGTYVTIVDAYDTQDISSTTPTTTKSILVDRSEQRLYAYDGDTLFMSATTSTGLDSTPTPRGIFTIYRKTPSRYMQGPLPNINSDDYYDLPGVPWNLYFTDGGAVIHGAYWHDKFGTKYSHGCVNLNPTDARTIFEWAELGTTVTVRD
ncbi:MAG: L,D-transpeptidase family protein, partial [Patescibacteria group bacterium]